MSRDTKTKRYAETINTDVSGFPSGLKNLTNAEISQLEAIGAITISSAQWGYVGGANQATKKSDSPTFEGLTLDSLTLNAVFKLVDNSPAQITANQNNYAPGDFSVLRLSTDASRDVTGFSGGAQGRLLILFNVGANDIVLKHQDANSTAGNRILANTAADITISANEIAFLWYDSTTARWRATEL